MGLDQDMERRFASTLHASLDPTRGACGIDGEEQRRWHSTAVALGCLLLGVLVGTVTGCSPNTNTTSRATAVSLQGEAMGTTWSATLVPAEDQALPGNADLQARISAIIEAVEGPLSTWRKDSEISRFNGLGPGESLEVGAAFSRCLETSARVNALTGGAFDPTVGPLVEAYGFGAHAVEVALPSDADLAALRDTVGLSRLEWDPSGEQGGMQDGMQDGMQGGELGRLTQVEPPLKLDLSAVAKGQAVDAVLEDLAHLDLAGVFFELGGEAGVCGVSPRGDRWRVGVERPAADLAAPRVLEVPIELFAGVVATSGFSRNQRQVGGVWLAHTFDPRTGQPAEQQVGSATVIASDGGIADAMATALCVLTPEAGLAVVEDFDGTEALLLIPRKDGTWEWRYSSGLERTSSGALRLSNERDD